VHDVKPEPAQPVPARGRRPSPVATSSPEDQENDRGLRGLVGSGTSQVNTHAALRARDASRPDDADLAEAEKGLVIVRRHWVPREELPRR